MWTKRLISPSPEFQNRIDLIRQLIEQLTAKEINGSWIHVELVKEGGLFQKLVSGKTPFAEVAFDNNYYELNLGFQKNQTQEVPSHWQKTKYGFQKILRSDLEALCNWIDSFLKNCADLPEPKISGWIDGL